MARCGTSTPLGRPVEPEVYITYAAASGSAAIAGASAGSAAIAAASASTRTTRAAWGGRGSARDDFVTSTGTAVSASMKASRSAGYDGSSGTYAPPALSAASVA